MSVAASVGGWLAAAVTAVAVLAIRRGLAARMEAVARVCHELRGPITAARLGLAASSRAGELSTARLRAIDAELGRASLALDDLADLRRGPGAGAVRLGTLERVDLRELVGGSVEAWRGPAAAGGRELTLAWSGRGPAIVWGHRGRLAQALGNLIANALEHGAGPVAVTGTSGAGRVLIAVTDGGSGLPAPVAEIARGARRGRGARGRGLAIASSIASAHGGRLAAAPAGRGARLVLELPTAGGSTARAG